MKYKLEIPEKYMGVVTDTLRGHNGQTLEFWDDLVHDTGWLKEVKEPMTCRESYSQICNISIPPNYFPYTAFEATWNAGRENLLLEQENERG